MDVVFASIISQLQPELREALITSGLDDPGLLRAYPRTPVKDLRAQGLGVGMATSTTTSPTFPPFFPSSMCPGFSVPLSCTSVPLVVSHLCFSSQPQGPQEPGLETSATAARASGLALRTSSTPRPKAPERRRILKKRSTLPTGASDGSHEQLDGWSGISSSSTISPCFTAPLLGSPAQPFFAVSGRSSREVSVGFSASSGLVGPSQSDPRGPLIPANQAKTHISPLKSDVREFRDFPGRSGGSTVEPEFRGNSSLLQLASSSTSSAQNHWTDEIILYFTLVADKVVPDGFCLIFYVCRDGSRLRRIGKHLAWHA